MLLAWMIDFGFGTMCWISSEPVAYVNHDCLHKPRCMLAPRLDNDAHNSYRGCIDMVIGTAGARVSAQQV
jgi:hypothetical protein